MTAAVYFPFLVPGSVDELGPSLDLGPSGPRLLAEAEDVVGRDLRAALAATVGRPAESLSAEDWLVHTVARMAACLALAGVVPDRTGIHPAVTGGQCLGAWVAAVHAGAVGWGEVLDIVRVNAHLEAECFGDGAGPLGSVVLYLPPGLDPDHLLDGAGEPGADRLELSLVLGRGVVAVAGPVRDLDGVVARVRDRGGRLLYTSNRVEHCGRVRLLQERLTPEMHRHRWSVPEPPIVSEIDGSLLRDGAAVRDDLLGGMTRPARWEHALAGLRAAGVDTVLLVSTNRKTMLDRVLADDFTVVHCGPAELLPEGTR